MRPYLAVLKDSLREVLASRILWLLTGLITLVLFVGLAPFTLCEETAARLQRNEFRSGPEFLKLLAAQEKAKGGTPARRIWSRLSEPMHDRLQSLRSENINEQVAVLMNVRGELNGMLNSDDLYDPKIWPPKTLTNEAQRLLERGLGDLSGEERRRFNRLLIDAAFPEYILPAPGKNLYATWFGYRLGAPLPFEPKQLPLLVRFALATLTTYLAGILGVFIAVLVTAPIVPQTFEPGAIDLLLSKPVSRSILFLTKFFGAAAFILVNAIYLIGGMWLIAGLRFDIWSGPLLLCIPISIFLFVIYYAVSAFTGVIWRNAVVSVCCTIVFWGLCFSVGVAKSLAENTFLNPTRLASIVPAGEKLFAVNRAGQTFEWSTSLNSWEEVFRGRAEGGPALFFRANRDNLVGPVYDPKGDRLCAVEWTPTRFELFGGAGKLLVGPRKEDWRRIESAVTPSAPQAIFVDPQGKILVVSLSGVYRFEGDAAREHRPFTVWGVDLAPHDRSARFVSVYSSPGSKWQRPLSAAMNPADGTLAVVSRGKLSVVVPNTAKKRPAANPADREPVHGAAEKAETRGPVGKGPPIDAATPGKYILKNQINVEQGKGELVTFAGSKIAVALADGRIRLFAGNLLVEETPLSPPEKKSAPRELAASPNGRWLAERFDNGTVWLVDLKGRTSLSKKIGGQGDISTVAFSEANELLVSDRLARVTTYTLEPFEASRSFEPPADLLQILYRYIVTPLYTVFPKPGELDSVAAYLVVGDPIDLFGQERQMREGLSMEKRPPMDIWRPIWSNLAFLVAMLTITCIYVARRDF